MPIPTPLECDKENEWFTEELPSRKYGGYRSRIRSGEFDHPCGDLARRGSDLGGGRAGGGAFGRLLSAGCEGYGTLSHEECR